MGKAADSALVPYGWAIEYGSDHKGQPIVSILLVSKGHDEASATQRAAELHGVKVALFADRRKEDAC